MTLNGNNMCSIEAAHAECKSVLHLPDYYGANLDALWDCLSETAGEIVLTHTAAMLNALGTYGCKLLQVFFDAAQENHDITFRLEEKGE